MSLGRPAPARPAGSSYHTPALVSALVAITMVGGIVSSLGAPLIPSVARTLGVSLPSAQWSLTVALLSASVAAPIMGRLGDGRYRRETILVGLTIVLAGGLAAGIARSLPVLIAGRAMQGVGLGLAPVTMAAARDHLRAEHARKVIATLSVSGAAAVGVGYPLSGLIAADLGLRAAFLFGSVLSAGLLAVSIKVIPSTRTSRPMQLDVKGAVLGAAALVALLVPLAEGEQWGWSSPLILGLLSAAIVLAATWVRGQLRRRTPLVDLRLLRYGDVQSANLAAFVLGVALYMFLTVVTEFVQEPSSEGYGLAASSLVAGLCLVPFSTLSLAASRTTVAVERRVPARVLLVAGCAIIALAGAFFALFHRAVWEALVTMGVIGVGFGYTFAAIPGLINRAVPSRETGSAMGMYQVVRYVGFSVGSALAAAILAGHRLTGSSHPAERGYVITLWAGVGICLLAAAAPVLIAERRPQTSPDRLSLAERQRLALDDAAELAVAGLVGVEAGPRAADSPVTGPGRQ